MSDNRSQRVWNRCSRISSETTWSKAPAVIAVAIFHFVYSWNDFFGPLLYLSTKPELQTLAIGLASFEGIHYRNPAYVQAGTIMTMIIPIVIFLAFQRFFTRGIVISGVEK